jgi:hypothetical protein
MLRRQTVGEEGLTIHGHEGISGITDRNSEGVGNAPHVDGHPQAAKKGEHIDSLPEMLAHRIYRTLMSCKMAEISVCLQ